MGWLKVVNVVVGFRFIIGIVYVNSIGLVCVVGCGVSWISFGEFSGVDCNDGNSKMVVVGLFGCMLVIRLVGVVNGCGCVECSV